MQKITAKIKTISSNVVHLFAVVAVVAMVFSVVSGGDVYASADCAEAGKQTSFNWGSSCAKVGDLVSMVFKVLSGLVGVAVVIGITWGGMLYASSNGNAAKAQQGITVIVNAVIGLLLFIFTFAITNFLVPGGILG